jgi:hypothetical protein
MHNTVDHHDLRATAADYSPDPDSDENHILLSSSLSPRPDGLTRVHVTRSTSNHLATSPSGESSSLGMFGVGFIALIPVVLASHSKIDSYNSGSFSC